MATFSQKHHAVAVVVDRMSKDYGDQRVLENISFQVDPGEIFVIMGPSGSGKSVLLKNIIGLESADEGAIYIDGLDASIHETHVQVITSIVFQAGALFNSLSVYDNLALYPREHGLLGKEALHKEVMDTLKILSLEKAAYKFPSQLSGGMKKRVSIARALMMKPQLILYDEPTSELDPIMAATMAEIIATLKEKYHVTSIVVTHDRDLAMAIGDRVALIYDGKIVAIDTPGGLQRMENPIVKEFLNPKIDLSNPRFKKYLQ